jgi:hypothetical protein
MVNQTLKNVTDLLLALPAIIAAIGSLIATIRARQPAQVATRELASEASPSVAMLMEQTKAPE